MVHAPRGKPEVIAFAASAGGFHVLLEILRALPAAFAVPIVIVMHVGTEKPYMLPDVLRRASRRSVQAAADGNALAPGTVYVAPPDRHLVLRPGGHLALTHDPREHRVRPAADPLFASAALAFGERVVAVVLSGSGTDGASGARAVHDAGGVVLVQDPSCAQFPSMPRATIAAEAADEVLPVRDIPPALLRLAS
jgi:two-component system chemotaxis response regulator CheB